MSELDLVFVENTSQLRAWLLENYAQKKSVWLVKWKKGFGESYLNYHDMVDELICFGWIDSLPRNLDKEKTRYRISPRDPKSNWSKANKERVHRLVELGKMEEQGLKMVETAKVNGTWDFLDDVEKLVIPDDLEKAFINNEKARYFFNRFPDSSKRNILEWIKTAKQDSTRQKRITETISKAIENTKANHPKGRDSGPEEK